VKANKENTNAIVTYDKSKVSLKDIEAAVRKPAIK